jgi:hypothetical protein
MRRFSLLPFLAISVLALVAIGCGDDDDPVTPPPDSKAVIGIMHDDSTHFAMIEYLETEGYEVTNLGLYEDYTGTDFSAFDLVFLLTGYEYGEDIPDSVQQGLLDFMDGGGTLVTNEWFLYSENNDLLTAVLPLSYDGDYCDDGESACIDTLTVDVVHALTEGLPDTFTTPPDYTYSFLVLHDEATSTNVMNLISGVTGGAMLGVGDWGEGHTIHWNNAGCYDGPDIWDDNTLQILQNIVDFAR